jgi:putative ABC transport system permease protein
MKILRLAWRSIRQRPLSSILTTISVSLGVALTIAIIALRDSARASYLETARGYDVIIGPTSGSPLQIVLNTMFHVGDAGGTIPWEAYETVQKDPRVKYAVPYAVGDMFLGHHVVGTSTDLFKALEDGDGTALGVEMRGKPFRDGVNFEAVAGAVAAADTGMRLGSTFRVTHGTSFEEHAEVWKIVGIMRPTGTPADRALFIPIETFYEIDGHEQGAEAKKKRRDERAEEAGHAHAHDDGHEHGTKEELGLSAVGLRMISAHPMLRLGYVADVRDERGPIQAVLPADQIRGLFTIVGAVDGIFRVIAWLIVVVASIGILVSLYNTIQGRRREIAILRALGARARDIFAVIVLEALLLCLLGGFLGLLLGHAGVLVAAPYLLQEYGAMVSTGIGMLDVQILCVLAGIGLVVGLLPAWRGLRTPVAENLYPTE